MAFKKTAEGRVFFQNLTKEQEPENTQRAQTNPQQKSAAQSPQLRTAPAQSGGAANQSQTQFQIIALLKTLNAKLQNTQAERDSMKKQMARYESLITKLEEKANRTQDAYATLSKSVKSKDQEILEQARRSEQIAQEAMSELEEARKLILDLEEKSELSQKQLQSHAAQRKKIEAALAERKAEYDSFQKKLSDYSLTNKNLTKRLNHTEEKQEAISLQLSNTESKQEMLDRKLEKTVQERGRMLRKVERIEEAVMQTRDALNAKAMVLLANQTNAEGALAMPASLDNMDEDSVQALLRAQADAAQKSEQEQMLPWWKKPININPVSAASFAILAILAGWMISQIQKPALTDLENFERFDMSASQQGTAPPPPAATQGEEPGMLSSIGQSSLDQITEMRNQAESFVSGLMEEEPAPPASNPANETQDTAPATQPQEQPQPEQAEPEQTDAQAAQTEAPAAATASVNDDIGTLDINDTETLMKMMDENPERVAQELNAIEPSTIPAPIKVQEEARAAAAENIAEANIDAIPSTFADNPDRYNKTDPNLPEPVQKIEAQALEGNANAQHDLAAIYTAGHGGVAQDYERAAYWFEKSARGGVANAAYNLAVLYHQGLGLKTDLPRAVQWYQAAAAMNHPEAQYNLGIAHIEGVGVEYDPFKAAAYFENAADNGVLEAAYNLGLIYENGLMGEPQPDKAIMWYKIAADAGSPEAKTALQQLAKGLEIPLAEVNRLAETMKVAEGRQADPKENQDAKIKF